MTKLQNILGTKTVHFLLPQPKIVPILSQRNLQPLNIYFGYPGSKKMTWGGWGTKLPGTQWQP